MSTRYCDLTPGDLLIWKHDSGKETCSIIISVERDIIVSWHTVLGIRTWRFERRSPRDIVGVDIIRACRDAEKDTSR